MAEARFKKATMHVDARLEMSRDGGSNPPASTICRRRTLPLTASDCHTGVFFVTLRGAIYRCYAVASPGPVTHFSGNPSCPRFSLGGKSSELSPIILYSSSGFSHSFLQPLFGDLVSKLVGTSHDSVKEVVAVRGRSLLVVISGCFPLTSRRDGGSLGQSLFFFSRRLPRGLPAGVYCNVSEGDGEFQRARSGREFPGRCRDLA